MMVAMKLALRVLVALAVTLQIMTIAGAADRPSSDVPKLQLQPVLTGLDRPVYLTNHGTPTIYVIEQPGKVRVYENGKLREKPFLDITSKANIDYECGLLSIAFHPKFAENGYVYAYYTAQLPALKSIVAEYKLEPGADHIDAASERILFHFSQPTIMHKGGQLQFGPDGMLYISTGDGGSFNDPFNHGQSGETYLGKILRIDVTSKRDPYAIPKDNPFLNDNTFYPEIYAYGFRNPWRFSFDRATGLLYCADVGQEKWEEIDIVRKGGNYGWRIKEGTEEVHPVPRPPKTIDPIYQYAHNGASMSVTGGCVYRGKACPSLVGWYIFGDYVDGRIFALKYEEGKTKAAGVAFTPPTVGSPKGIVRPKNLQPSAFGEDADGELYVCDVTNGRVFKVVEDSEAAQAGK
jgi:glucose/arabinose dehydrogenase